MAGLGSIGNVCLVWKSIIKQCHCSLYSISEDKCTLINILNFVKSATLMPNDKHILSDPILSRLEKKHLSPNGMVVILD